MIITKTQFDSLSEDLQSAFTKNDEGVYTNNEEEVSGLKSALAKEKEAKVKAAQERDSLIEKQEKAIEKARAEALKEARSNNDFKTLEEDYKRRAKEAQEEIKELRALNEQHITQGVHNEKINSLSQLFVAPDAMKPYLNTRVKTTVENGQAVTRVLDKNGQASAASLDDLRNEILQDESLKDVLLASKASGSSAQPTPTQAPSSNFSAKNASIQEMVARVGAKIGA